MNRTNIILASLALFALAIASAVADIPDASGNCAGDLVETTPSSEFRVVGDGSIVLHERTGLEWRRCSEGMSWNGSGCDGTADTHTWHDALQVAAAAGDGWRLPNIEELNSIVERCRIDPAINAQVFPGTLSNGDLLFWSASPYSALSSRPWHADFKYGSIGFDWGKSTSLVVRLVRDGQ